MFYNSQEIHTIFSLEKHTFYMVLFKIEKRKIKKSKYLKVLTWKLSNMYIMCSILCQRHRKHFVSFCLFTIFYAKVYAHNLHIFIRFMIYLAQSEKAYLISANCFLTIFFLAWFNLRVTKSELAYSCRTIHDFRKTHSLNLFQIKYLCWTHMKNARLKKGASKLSTTV